MFCTGRPRRSLDDIDRRWPWKLAFRLMQTLLCIAAVGCAASTLLMPVHIKPGASDDARKVIIYIPAVRIELGRRTHQTLC